MTCIASSEHVMAQYFGPPCESGSTNGELVNVLERTVHPAIYRRGSLSPTKLDDALLLQLNVHVLRVDVARLVLLLDCFAGLGHLGPTFLLKLLGQ